MENIFFCMPVALLLAMQLNCKVFERQSDKQMLVIAINEPGSPKKGITLLRRELAKWQKHSATKCPTDSPPSLILYNFCQHINRN